MKLRFILLLIALVNPIASHAMNRPTDLESQISIEKNQDEFKATLNKRQKAETSSSRDLRADSLLIADSDQPVGLDTKDTSNSESSTKDSWQPRREDVYFSLKFDKVEIAESKGTALKFVKYNNSSLGLGLQEPKTAEFHVTLFQGYLLADEESDIEEFEKLAKKIEELGAEKYDQTKPITYHDASISGFYSEGSPADHEDTETSGDTQSGLKPYIVVFLLNDPGQFFEQMAAFVRDMIEASTLRNKIHANTYPVSYRYEHSCKLQGNPSIMHATIAWAYPTTKNAKRFVPAYPDIKLYLPLVVKHVLKLFSTNTDMDHKKYEKLLKLLNTKNDAQRYEIVKMLFMLLQESMICMADEDVKSTCSGASNMLEWLLHDDDYEVAFDEIFPEKVQFTQFRVFIKDLMANILIQRNKLKNVKGFQSLDNPDEELTMILLQLTARILREAEGTTDQSSLLGRINTLVDVIAAEQTEKPALNPEEENLKADKFVGANQKRQFTFKFTAPHIARK